MTIFFVNDTVLPNDPDGLGNWAFQHYQEHRLFVQMQMQGTGLQVTDADIAIVPLQDPVLLTEWLSTHSNIHNTLRQIANFTGTDLSNVDLSDDGQWFQWMDAHASEHRAIRAAFGITS
jgi:hypothetical protein